MKVVPTELANTLVALRNDPDVLFAEPDYLITFQAVPNDPGYGPGYYQQWGLAAVRAPQAWDFYTGDPNFRVAVVDTGIAYDHPDLVNNIWTNPLEQPGDANGDGCPGICGVDDDGDGEIDEVLSPGASGLPPGTQSSWDDDENGYVDDIHGFDFAGDNVGNNDSDPYLENIGLGPHGTQVAGILAARTNNGIGVAGMVWQCKIVALKFMRPDGSSSETDVIEALTYARVNKIRITNNSWEFPGYSQELYNTIQWAKLKGHLFIAGAGNNKKDLAIEPWYPACYTNSNIITVGGSDPNDALWNSSQGGSNWGSVCVDLVAPAEHLYTTTYPDAYVYGNGTSGSAPFVAGTAALIMGQNPGMSYQQVRRQILDTTRFAPGMICNTATSGILDAAAALGDCNSNTVLDATDIANQTSTDCNNNGLPDECDYDCDGNGIPEQCEAALFDPCCFSAYYCHDCTNLTPCECAARGGISRPSTENCRNFDCLSAPD